MQSINPYLAKEFKTFQSLTEAQIEDKLNHAAQGFATWKKTSFNVKMTMLEKLAFLLLKEKKKYATCISQEMGKLLKEAIAEIEKCATLCNYYAQHAESILNDRPEKALQDRSYVTFQPLGIILGIMPWNFPFWQAFRFIVPALCAGNVVLLKHASNVPWCAQVLETLFREADLPTYAFQNLHIPSSRVENLIADGRIKGVSLTGSIEAGRSVAQACGRHLKKCVLELGGSDPYIVLQDADLEFAVETCIKSRLLNAGQSCVSAKRFIVESSIHDIFIEKMLAKMQAIQWGDPLLETTTLAPLALEKNRAQLHQQVQTLRSQGAQCILGGEIPEENGYFYPPTLFTRVSSTMLPFHEELFGPVACVFCARNEEEAILLANQTNFGLGCALFSKNITKAESLAKTHVEAGLCFVNGMVKSDPHLPFGGIKESGFGRELASFGLLEFTNIKTLVVHGHH